MIDRISKRRIIDRCWLETQTVPPDTEDIIIGERDSLADMIDDRAGASISTVNDRSRLPGAPIPLGKGLSMLTSTW